jgi:hypothetical protein
LYAFSGKKYFVPSRVWDAVRLAAEIGPKEVLAVDLGHRGESCQVPGQSPYESGLAITHEPEVEELAAVPGCHQELSGLAILLY